MCFDYDGYPEFSETSVVRARKAHRCNACRGPIAAGATYERQSGKSDGSFYVLKVCRRCCYDTARVVEHELAEGCLWGESWPAVEDLVAYLVESGMGQTDPAAVPESFKVGDKPQMPARPSPLERARP